MITIRRTCPECGGAMTVELLRRDPHDTPVLFLVCPCGYWKRHRRTSRPTWRTVPGCRDFRR